MIKANEIDLIYSVYKKGGFTKEKTLELIITKVLENPHFFGLERLSNESIIDFSTFIFLRIKKNLNRFDSNKASFCTFIQNIVRMEFLTWKKNKAKDNLHTKALESYSKDKYIYDEELFEQTFVADSSITQEYPNNSLASIPALDLIILALKSVYYLTPSQITKIIETTKINKTVFLKYLLQAHKCIIDRIKLVNSLSELISSDYIKRKELIISLEKVESQSTYSLICRDKISKIDFRLSKRKEKLSKMKITPSNRELSIILNINQNVISYIIRKNLKEKQ